MNKIVDRFLTFKNQSAIISINNTVTYAELGQAMIGWKKYLFASGIKRGDIIFLDADYHPQSIALLCALLDEKCIIALSTHRLEEENKQLMKIVDAKHKLTVNAHGGVEISSCVDHKEMHPLIKKLRTNDQAGIVIFTSGSTGISKACLHSANFLFESPSTLKQYRTISFLLFDHIGGLNTLLRCLLNGGSIVLPQDRLPNTIAQTILKQKVEALITTPSFLNMLILSGAIHSFDLSSLRIVNYGAEPMSQIVLQQLQEYLPQVKFKQSYGMSELGVLPTQSKNSNSLFVKLGGEKSQIRVVEGLLEVKLPSSMLGYLNAEMSVTEDGWFKTGDAVEEDGEYLRILGRKSEQINIGGEKTFPAQIEAVIQTMENVADVMITSEKNPLLGSLIKAIVVLKEYEEEDVFRIRLRKFCETRLSKFQIPQKIIIADSLNYGLRFKKMRNESVL